ncbi:MAG: thioredoxin [Bacteroidetes bacterium]|nr:thioredoxin [Bacteroidota bacterium]
MKRLLLILSLIIISSSTYAQNKIEVLYFHGKQRCMTCNAIEKITKEVLQSDYSEELEKGIISMKIYDISLEENRDIAKKYEVSWSTLLVNTWEKGVETSNDMTKTGFMYARKSPEQFKAELKNKINTFLKK